MINAQNNARPTTNTAKTFGPGNLKARIVSITLQEPGFDKHLKPYYLVYNLEGIDQGADFEGFLVDKNNPNGARYKGQVGQVKASYWPFKDGTNPKNPTQVFKRDDSIVTALLTLAKVLGKEEQFHQLNARTIEEYVDLASDLLAGDKYLAWCVAGKEYDDKNGYLKHDLFLPRPDNGQYAFETLGASPSKLQSFDNDKHIIKKSPTKPVNNFQPSQNFNQPQSQPANFSNPATNAYQPAQQGFGGQQQFNQPVNNGYNGFAMPGADDDDLPF